LESITHYKCVQRTDGENKDIYDKYENSVVVDGNTSPTFQMFRGVRWESVNIPYAVQHGNG
jgi:hypothetical protein